MSDSASNRRGKPRESMYSQELAAAVGYVVLQASHAEDTLGELVLRTGVDARFVEGWWASGEQLITALRAIEDSQLEPLIALYEELHPRRNIVVHGHAIPMGGDSLYVMKRAKSRKREALPPSYETGVLNVRRLEDLAADFCMLEAMAADAVSDVMGLR